MTCKSYWMERESDRN